MMRRRGKGTLLYALKHTHPTHIPYTHTLHTHTNVTITPILHMYTRCAESEVKADRSSRLLAQVNSGVEHLSEKLQHIKAVSC